MHQHEQYPSKLLSEAVAQFASLPGIGERTAIRLALFLLRQKKEEALQFGSVINNFVENIRYCKVCYNLSDMEICPICSSPARDKTVLCVVENVKDVMSVENTNQFNGLYHVLGGLISPMEGVGPGDIQIAGLEERIKNDQEIKEVIFALSATMEGDTTNFYLYRKLKNYALNFSVIARGVSFGDELEYTDEVTLGRSIRNRTPFDSSMTGS